MVSLEGSTLPGKDYVLSAGRTESENTTIGECLQPMMQPEPDRVGKKRIAKKPERPKPERNRLYFFQVVLEDDPIDVRGSPITGDHLWVSGGLAKTCSFQGAFEKVLQQSKGWVLRGSARWSNHMR